MYTNTTERTVQNRVVALFRQKLGYEYLGNWRYRSANRNIETGLLTAWLREQQVPAELIPKTLRELDQAAALGAGQSLYETNEAVYRLLRYGVKVKPGASRQTQTVWLINWGQPQKNHFALAEEVSLLGEHKRRPDLVLYVNGIALVVIELKRAAVPVSKAIRQTIDLQAKTFIRPFFSTVQLVLAGNDSEGLRYAAIDTPEKYYLTWKEENPAYTPQSGPEVERYRPAAACAGGEGLLDCALLRLANKERLLELIHDFIVFDKGTKKVPRPHQYFGVQTAQQRVKQDRGGIIWHTQGSGKSLTMVWLAKWIRENIPQARVLIITDRTELDAQIEGVFQGVDEQIYRTQSGADLLATLHENKEWLICSLVHKFGASARTALDDFLAELAGGDLTDFVATGKIFVFVDECHRTQSGKLHRAMKQVLPQAIFIGFTGTPLLKEDKKMSIEVFGSYIHTYKFDEAVADGIVLDLRYEARDIDQYLIAPEQVDEWFEANTKNLTDIAKARLKQRWGTMRQMLSSQSRLQMIVHDIWLDMKKKPRLMDGQGNAMLVCASIYQACQLYEMFSNTDLKGKCAVITSYKPAPADIKGEDAGAGYTEKLRQYKIYRRMLADFFDEPEETAMYKTEQFETEVKKRFVAAPGQMRLLIVVDKLLTGFDAPPATYLYIDKTMRDHGLFQAICRVNRLDGEDKEYGYIVDYKDLFNSLEGAVADYTGGALDGYDQEDVAGLLENRLEKARERLEETLETVRALCEPVRAPRELADYFRYFSAADTTDQLTLQRNEPKRLALYKSVAALVRAYANLATEMAEAGYSESQAEDIKAEVAHYENIREAVKNHSGDYVDMKQYEPAMRHLLDTYVQAQPSQKVTALEEMGLTELLAKKGLVAVEDSLPENIKSNPEAMAETIENNVRRVIIEEHPVNPKYYEDMSDLLDALIRERRTQALEYQVYLKKVKKLAEQVVEPETAGRYPQAINSRAKQALYDALDQNEALAIQVDTAVRHTRKDDWIGHQFKEREVVYAIRRELGDQTDKLEEIIELVKNQDEYQ